MSLVRIAVTARHDEDGLPIERRYVELVGEVDWPSLPERGDVWFHCGDWAGETVAGREFYMPVAPGSGQPRCSVAINTTEDVVDHIIEAHGFQE